jgi:hypothetical protein
MGKKNFKIRQRVRTLYSLDRIVYVDGGQVKPGDKVTVNGRSGIYKMSFKQENKMKIELDEPLGALLSCHPIEVRIAE